MQQPQLHGAAEKAAGEASKEVVVLVLSPQDAAAAGASKGLSPDGPTAADKPPATPAVAPDSKPADEPAKPKPSGVKPRQLLLSAMVVAIMSVPIVGILLPAFLTGRQERDDGDNGKSYLCVLVSIDPYLYSLNVLPANATAVNAYFNATNYNCSLASAYVFDGVDPVDPIHQAVDPTSTQGYVMITMQMTAIDPAISVALAQAEISFGGSSLVDYRNKLTLQKGYVLNIDFVTTAGADSSFKTGDRSTQTSPKLPVTAIKSLFNYPFDSYNVSVGIRGSLENTTGSSVEYMPLPLLLNFKTVLLGWSVQVQQTESWEEQAMFDGDTILYFSVIIERSSFVKFFAVMILTGMWLLTSFAIGYGIDLCYLRPRAAVIGDAGMYTGLLFAMNNIRGVMPGVPAVGVGVDFFGFIWIMMFLMLMGIQVTSRIVMLYVHPDPTIYDRVLKTEPYQDWLKAEKEKQEEAEKEKAEKEKAEKEKVEKEKVEKDLAEKEKTNKEKAGEGTAGKEKEGTAEASAPVETLAAKIL